MAKQDDNNNQPAKRVFRSADVHKRRADASTRQKPVKMPTRREAREEMRANVRINAESRARHEAQVDGGGSAQDARQSPAGNPRGESSPAPGFSVIHASPAPDSQGQFSGDSGADAFETATPSDRPVREPGTEEGGAPAKQVPEAEGRADASGTSATAPGGSSSSPEGASGAPSAHPAQSGKAASQEAEAADAEGAFDEGPAGKKARKGKRRSSPRRRRIIVGAIVAVAVIALVVGGFAFNRWGRFNDRADIQGVWYVLGTEVTVRIDDTSIYLSDDVSYLYQLDDYAKTITYTFGPMKGEGRYWFTDDRAHLVITDGKGYTPGDTTAEDLVRAFLDFAKASSGEVVQLPEGDGIIAFSRTPEINLTVERQQEGAE